MAYKLVNATELRTGSFIEIEKDFYVVKSIETSKTGKHGHAKCRIEANSLTGGKKKVLVVPGHERFEVPMIDKRKAQVLSVHGDSASVMDLESYENFDIDIPEEFKEEVKEQTNVEYWDIEGTKMIKRIL